MRTARVLGQENAQLHTYHVMSRVIDGQMIFDDVAKEHFRGLLTQLLGFCDIGCITFCIMGNHFHLLIQVPNARYSREKLEAMSDEALLRRLELIYSEKQVTEIATQLEDFRASGMDRKAVEFRAQFFDRMHDLAEFMRQLKQRFSQWHNCRVRRKGPLWQDRYKSVLVEESESALRTMAAYIDLNPIRAKIVEDPKDYRWSGYGEAVAGKKAARAGLARLVCGEIGEDERSISWKEVQQIYRCWLYAEGREQEDLNGKITKRGFSASESESVLAEEGRLAQPVLAAVRLRHLSDGVAIGTKGFLEEVFSEKRKAFGSHRTSGAKSVPWVKWGRLQNMRELREGAR